MKVLSSQEQERLLASVREKLGMRNSMMIRVFLFTGVRVSELCGLIMDDIYIGSEVKKYLMVRSGIAKGGTSREIPLPHRKTKECRIGHIDKYCKCKKVR